MDLYTEILLLVVVSAWFSRIPLFSYGDSMLPDQTTNLVAVTSAGYAAQLHR